MGYLSIDGVPISVATASPRKGVESIGLFERSYNGAGMIGVRGAKCTWAVETTPMSEAAAAALETFLDARGIYLPFAGSSPNSSSGYIPTTATYLTYGASGPSGNPTCSVGVSPDGELSLVSATRNPLAEFTTAWSANVWVKITAVPASKKAILGWANMSLVVDDAGKVKWQEAGWSNSSLTGTDPDVSNLGWHMITAVTYLTAAGTVYYELWGDGTLKASYSVAASTLAFRDLSAVTAMGVASYDVTGSGSLYTLPGSVSQLLLVPCRLDSSIISSLYNSGSGVVLGSWPKHAMSGDIIGGLSAVSAYAAIKDSDPVEFYQGSAWVNNGRKVRFDLIEV